MESTKVEIAEMIDKSGDYNFEIVKAVLIDSGKNPDGSEKNYKNADGTDKKFKPVYEDRTPEIYLVLRDVVSRKIHVHRMALAAFAKMNSFSAADIKDNKLRRSDERDNYALYEKGGKLFRIPAIEGEEAFDQVRQIYSRFVSVIGMEEGTTPDQAEEFVGKHFKGTLKEDTYTSNNDEEKSRLKLQTNFKPLSEETIAAITANQEVEQEFN